MPIKLDITGQRFGRLVAISQIEKPRAGGGVYHMWKCLCDCGGTITTRVANLRNGSTQSCGCLQRERAISQIATMSKPAIEYFCKVCGKKFIARKNKNRSYCSLECKREAELNPRPETVVTCDVCGKQFKPRSKGLLQLRCSRRCKLIADARSRNQKTAMSELREIATELEKRINE